MRWLAVVRPSWNGDSSFASDVRVAGRGFSVVVLALFPGCRRDARHPTEAFVTYRARADTAGTYRRVSRPLFFRPGRPRRVRKNAADLRTFESRGSGHRRRPRAAGRRSATRRRQARENGPVRRGGSVCSHLTRVVTRSTRTSDTRAHDRKATTRLAARHQRLRG